MWVKVVFNQLLWLTVKSWLDWNNVLLELKTVCLLCTFRVHEGELYPHEPQIFLIIT
jgi:hypothetical protein